jgi:cytochrome c oxidase subunit 2
MEVIVHEEADYEQWKKGQEAWLKQNPDYLKRVPAALQEAAMIKAGLQKDPGSTVAENEFNKN